MHPGSSKHPLTGSTDRYNQQGTHSLLSSLSTVESWVVGVTLCHRSNQCSRWGQNREERSAQGNCRWSHPFHSTLPTSYIVKRFSMSLCLSFSLLYSYSTFLSLFLSLAYSARRSFFLLCLQNSSPSARSGTDLLQPPTYTRDPLHLCRLFRVPVTLTVTDRRLVFLTQIFLAILRNKHRQYTASTHIHTHFN